MEKKEDIILILKNAIEEVKDREDISLHNICLLLGYSLRGVKSKKDLYANEIENIKIIRELIKGL